MSNEQIRIFEDFLLNPGWLLYKEYLRKRWGPEGYGRRMDEAIAKAEADNTDAVVAVKQVQAIAKEVNALTTWPLEQLKHLKITAAHEASEPSLSRRGPGQ